MFVGDNVIQPQREHVGWRIDNWCDAVGILRAQFYRLSPERRPHAMHLSKRLVIVTESPADWLKRVGSRR